MLTGLVIGALSAAAFLPQTDTIVQADGASRLELEVFQGEVMVRTWDRDAVQVKTGSSDSPSIEVHRSGQTLSVGVDMERGRRFAHGVDFDITVPRGFDLNIEGVALAVDIQGAQGRIEVTTVHGPITVHGGMESIALESVNGPIHVEGARGDLEITGVAGGVTILDCIGDVFAQSFGGALTLQGITSTDVEAGTVGGTLRYEGDIADGGRYNFGSHGGQIWLSLPDNINAQVDILTLAGDVDVDYPGVDARPTRGEGIPGLKNKELRFELGNGSARIEVETFGGTVHILRQGG